MASSAGAPARDGSGGATATDAGASGADVSSMSGAGGTSGASSSTDAGGAGGTSGASSVADAGDAGGSPSLDAGGTGGGSSLDAGGAGGSSALDAGGAGGDASACTPGNTVTWSHGYDVGAMSAETQLASDSHDATLVSGRFHGTLDLGGASYSSAINAYCDNFNPSDGFLLKLDANGGYVWSEHFTSGVYGGASINDAIFDPTGDAIAVGTFTQSTTMGGVTYNNPPPPCMGSGPPGGEGAFIVKRAGADGAPLWSRGLTTPDGSVWVPFLAADPSGNVVVSGSYQGTLDPGGGALSCSSTAFIAKYSGTDGALLWSHCLPGSHRIVTDENGDVVLAAYVNTPVDFGAGPVATSPALYLVRYDGATGALASTKILATGSVGPIVLRRVGADLYVGGEISTAADFGNGPYTPIGQSDMFLARFKIADGSLVWVKMFGASLSDYVDTLATDACGLLIGGQFYNSIDFGLGPIVASTINVSNRFLLHLTTDGDTLSATGLGPTGSGSSLGYGLAPASDGGAFISGWTSQSIDLYGTTFAAPTNGQKLFVARLAP